MEPQMLSFVRLGIIVLLPMIPSLLLFMALPSKAIVSGLLQGWKVNLSGAFGAYFALVLVVISTHSVWDPAPTFQIWTVDGRVTDENNGPLRLLQAKEIITDPPPITTNEAGTFKIEVHTAVGQTGNIRYPSLMIIRDSYLPQPIELDPVRGKDLAKELGIEWEPKLQQIHISHIKLHRPPVYAPAGEPPVPVPAQEAPRP